LERTIDIENLEVTFATREGSFRAVRGVTLQLTRGQTLGLVGESGCGKSVTAMSLVRLLPLPNSNIRATKFRVCGSELLTLKRDEMARFRGNKVGVIFQEPMAALNPVLRVGDQIEEVLCIHFPDLSSVARKKRVEELLTQVGISSPKSRMKEFPHSLSGGMRQRVMIAMALAGEPELLIADEPTTALDVTIQAQILALINELQRKHNMSLVLISHDLAVVAAMADIIHVMYGGFIVESASPADLIAHPKHPYTKGLLMSRPNAQLPRKSRLPSIKGQVMRRGDDAGCPFRDRCSEAKPVCDTFPMNIEKVGDNHQVSCARWKELT
jgi:oligopeptide/dipeptide ABC transporter ATP-binding protein